MTSDKRPSVWDDPNVKAAMKTRPASEVEVLNCPCCGHLRYYNLGSHFYCPHCDRTWYVLGENEDDPLDGRPCMRPDYVLTMEDVIAAECEDY